MATITAYTSSVRGEFLDVLDPATWDGGVVPGPGDSAVFPDAPYTVTNETYNNSNGTYHTAPYNRPWSGSHYSPVWEPDLNEVASMRLSNASALDNIPSTTHNQSGSIYVHLAESFKPVKINYERISSNYLISMSLDIQPDDPAPINDPMNYKWTSSLSGSYVDASADESVVTGFWKYNSGYVFSHPYRYQLTGSWTVGKIEMGRFSHLRLTGSSYLTLDTTTVNHPEINFRDGGVYACLEVRDESTIAISGSNASTSTQHGVDIYRTSAVTIHLSGSANYTSSMLADNYSTGDTKIQVTDSASFETGDIISIQSPPKNRWKDTYSNKGFTYTAYNASTMIPTIMATGSTFGPAGQANPQGWPVEDILTDEVCQVYDVTGDDITIGKFHSRFGYVQGDLGTYNYEAYVQAFDDNPGTYNGTLKAIAVNSEHKSYAAGESIIINNKSYNIKRVGTYLSQSQFIDFTNAGGAKPQDHFVWSPYHGSGSGFTTQPTSAPFKIGTYYYWDEIYRKGTIWGSGSVQGDGGSFHIDSSSIMSFTDDAHNATKYTAYAVVNHIISRSFWNEGEIVISASIADTLYNDSGKTYNARGLVGIEWPAFPYQNQNDFYEGGEPVANTNNPYMPTMYGFSGYYGPYIKAPDDRASVLRIPINQWDSGSFSYIDNFGAMTQSYKAFSSSFTNNVYNSGTSFSIRWSREGDYNKFYHRDSEQETQYFENYTYGESAGITINVHEWAKIFSIDIKQRCQVLFLDTTDSFAFNDQIKDSELLYDHTTSDKVKWMATEVTDPMGYKNINWDWYEKRGQTGIHPYIQGWTFNNANYLNNSNNRYYTGKYYTTALTVLGKFADNEGAAFPAWANASNEFTVDLGAEVEFDTIGMWICGSQYYGEGSYTTAAGYTGNTITSIGIDTGDTTDTSAYSTFRAVANDTRQSTGRQGIRYYTTGSGATTKARIIRVKIHRGSKSTSGNRVGFFGVYKGHNGSDAKKIKLANVKHFKVGDSVFFISRYAPRFFFDGLKRSTSGYQSFVQGSVTDLNDTNGGFRFTYEITAIDTANKTITLNRDPVYQHITPGTLCYKANRGNVRLKVDDSGIHYGGFNLYANYSAHSRLRMENTWIDGFNWGGTTNQSYWKDIRDSVITPRFQRAYTMTNYSSGRMTNMFAMGGFGNYTGNSNIVNKFVLFNCLVGNGSQKISQFRSDDHIRLSNFIFDVNRYSHTSGVFNNFTNNTTYRKRLGQNRVPIVRNSIDEGYYANYGYNAMNVNDTYAGLGQIKLFENNYVNAKYINYTTGRGYLGHSQPILNHILQNYRSRGRYVMPHGIGESANTNDGLWKYQTGVWEAETHDGFILANDLKFNNKPSMIQCSLSYGGGSPYYTVKEPTMFKLYTNSRMANNNPQTREAMTWKRCGFLAEKDCDITLSFSMEYRNTIGQLLQNNMQYGANSSYKIIENVVHANKYDSRHFFLNFIESDTPGWTGTIIDTQRLDSDSKEFTTHSYHKTFSIKKGHYYTFNMTMGQYFQTYNGLVHMMDYKMPSFNIFVNDFSDIEIDHSTFDAEKTFDSYDNNMRNNNSISRNQGRIPTKRQAGSQTSVVKLNKIKM